MLRYENKSDQWTYCGEIPDDCLSQCLGSDLRPRGSKGKASKTEYYR